MSNTVFEKKKFIEHVIGKCHLHNNVFAILAIENVCDYAINHYGHTCDRAAYFIADILPGIDFAEVAAYFSDSQLTEHGKQAKSSYWQEQAKDIDGRLYYFLDCMDADIGDRYFTAEQLQEITGQSDPLTEKAIIRLAANHEATLYRYNRDKYGNYINQECIYDCMYI